MQRISRYGMQGDTILGAPEEQCISGTLGNDLIYGHYQQVETYVGEDGNTYVQNNDGSIPPPPIKPDFIFAWSGNDTIWASQASDTVIGGEGNDLIRGNGIFGSTGRGENSYAMWDAADVLLGGAGDDGISGAGGDDFIMGEEGNDRLSGDWGRDILLGGQGADTLIGGFDADTMTGGQGADTFTFGFGNIPYAGNSIRPETGTGQGNRDVITDFQPGLDKIVLMDVSQATGAILIITEDAGNTVLNYAGRHPFLPDTLQNSYRAEIELVGRVNVSMSDIVVG